MSSEFASPLGQLAKVPEGARNSVAMSFVMAATAWWKVLALEAAQKYRVTYRNGPGRDPWLEREHTRARAAFDAAIDILEASAPGHEWLKLIEKAVAPLEFEELYGSMLRGTHDAVPRFTNF
jgi:hypothetical protein